MDSDWDYERITLAKSLLRDIEALWADILRLAAVVEDMLNNCIVALCDGQIALAEEITHKQSAMGRWEIQIEHGCVRVLALHQPVASDLRRVTTILKINGDLERLYALARHIAKRAKKMVMDPQAFPIPQALENLALSARAQIHDALDALTQSDVLAARAVIAGDQEIDKHYRTIRKQLKLQIVNNPDRINTWLRFVNTARNLERIADHAVQIAEAVIYLLAG
jgi:phosphate transport system protein